jgi:Holliday junction resolvase RusA-like endonuclease
VIEFVIPFEDLVSANERLIPGRQGQLVNSSKYRKKLTVMVTHVPVGRHVRPGRWACSLRFYFPDARRRDHHNYQKAILDALEGTFWEDDKDVVETHCRVVGIDAVGPRCVVRVAHVDSR